MTEKQIHWWGEVAQGFVFLGFLYLIMRMTDGASYKPTFAMPSWLRVAGVLLVIGVGATLKTRRFYSIRNRRKLAP